MLASQCSGAQTNDEGAGFARPGPGHSSAHFTVLELKHQAVTGMAAYQRIACPEQHCSQAVACDIRRSMSLRSRSITSTPFGLPISTRQCRHGRGECAPTPEPTAEAFFRGYLQGRSSSPLESHRPTFLSCRWASFKYESRLIAI